INFGVDAIPEDSTYCDIQTITLTGISSIPGVTFQWLNADGDTIADVPIVEVTPGSGPVCYRVIGTEIVSGCQDQEIVCLTPTFFSLDISDDQNICLGESIGLSVTDNNNQNLSYMWFPTENMTGSTTTTPTVTPTDTTEYCVKITNLDLGCDTTICTTVTVDLFDPFTVVITADPTPAIVTQNIHLTVNQPDNFGYMWESDPPTPFPVPALNDVTVIHPADPTTYCVTVTNLAGCTQVACITTPGIDIDCDMTDIGVPNIFSPNGDGENDEFRVLSNFISLIDLHIYNRWGQEVFKTTDPTMGWDGTFNGKRLPPDVYGYYLNITCPNQKEYFTKGNITLLE
ncbi:MAG TPA: gliding motility-associated C-terminal domain-containing protein, partial [Saprospiraceae bacterium]|nr:gliding motility-associated C-terminal domain-containing protein [Saprospiraceae bacterium]